MASPARSLASVLACTALALLCAGCGDGGLVLRERSFGSGFRSTGSIVVSDNLQHAAFIVRKNGKARVVTDGIPGEEYDSIVGGRLVFSPNGRRLAYIARMCGAHVAVVGGKTRHVRGKAFARSVVFSADGRRVAFIATRGRKYFVVADGIEGRPYDYVGTTSDWLSDIRCETVYFTADSRHLLYAAAKSNEWCVVCDGREGQAYTGIESVNPGVGGSAFGYTANAGGERISAAFARPADWYPYDRGGKLCVVVGGVVVGRYDWKPWWYTHPVFGRDGKRFAFDAFRNGREVLVLDGREVGRGYETVGIVGFSRDSRHFAYTAKAGGKWAVVLDGKEGKRYTNVAYVTFSRNNRLAYIANDRSLTGGLRKLLVVDGRELPLSPGLWGLTGISFSRDGKHVSCTASKQVARSQRPVIILDGKEYLGCTSVAYGAGGKRTAVACEWSPKRGLRILLDGKKELVVLDRQRAWRSIRECGEPLIMRQVSFTSDGRHVAYAYSVGEDPVTSRKRPGRKHVIGADGVALGQYDALLAFRGSYPETLLAADRSNRIHAIGVRKGELRRIEIEVGER